MVKMEKIILNRSIGLNETPFIVYGSKINTTEYSLKSTDTYIEYMQQLAGNLQDNCFMHQVNLHYPKPSQQTP